MCSYLLNPSSCHRFNEVWIFSLSMYSGVRRAMTVAVEGSSHLAMMDHIQACLMGYCIHSTVPKVCRLLPAVCALSLSLLNSNWMHWIKLHLKISVSPHWTAAFTYMCNRQENEQQCPLISIFFGNQLWVGEFTFLAIFFFVLRDILFDRK